MVDKESDIILAVDEELAPHIFMDEAQELQPIQKKFMESYLEHKDTMPVDEWLRAEWQRVSRNAVLNKSLK